AFNQRRELRQREAPVEDVDRGAGEQLLHHAVLACLVTQRLELDLPRRGSHDGRKVADAGSGGWLVEADRALERGRREGLGVIDGHPYRYSRALANLGGPPGELG